jgi:peroxiredoxin
MQQIMTGTAIGSYAPDFELPGTDGSVHHLTRYRENYQAVGVIIMCNSCPYVQLYLDRLKQLQSAFQTQGLRLVGINANDEQHSPEDSYEQMKAFAIAQSLNFPYLRDITQDVARSFGASTTPEAYLVDRRGVLRYRGAIDDNPKEPGAVQRPYLQTAIAQLLAGQPIETSLTRAIGCAVKWR